MKPSTSSRLVTVAIVLLAVTGVAGTVAADADGSLTTMNETVRVHAVENATIEGSADLSAGTTVSVRIQSTDDTSPQFFKSADATVGEDGTFAAEFDLADLAPGDSFSVTVATDTSTVAEAEGAVVAADEPVTPTATATETTGPGLGPVAAVSALAAAAAAAHRRS
ncbi:BGTF surface domain-containing protein [Halobaculum marinum]|uniref:BGTF surface domain-containing protein n=1 Tax=Halobaculum marinum TaxID=3031996 RepID=A0ABD5X292_9EURY|nr:BGTF surface domain-containing protein [Halobaculum sp. DT55]